MKYRPHLQRIFFLAVILNLIFVFSGAEIFSVPKIQKTPPENLQEIEWIETEETESAAPNVEVSEVEIFPEIVMPPLEIQHTEFEPLPKLNLDPPPVEIPKKIETEIPAKETTEPEKIETPPEEKSEESNPTEKLKVIVKVYPKDITDQLVTSGAIPKRVAPESGEIILAVTITVEGKVKNVEIRQGGGNGTDGALINFISETAAGSWIFEPYKNADGEPQELKTQIVFKPDDF